MLITSAQALALLPIEGIIYGKVKDIKQYDPFSGLLKSSYLGLEVDETKNKQKMSSYFALYQQGESMKIFCDQGQKLSYSNKVKEDTALRSIAASTQYIGLNYALRNIANYMKLLEFSEKEYNNLYKNLVRNSCSQNLTIFSHKMLLANFKYFWGHETNLEPPSLKDNNYFGSLVKKNTNTREYLERELYYTLNNFKSLCSWNSDTSNFALLTPYLKNPYLMSFVFNNMLGRRVSLDSKTGTTYFDQISDTSQIACENLICRKRRPNVFKKLFPVLSGSTNLEDNLKLLYCNKLQTHRSYAKDLGPEQRSWSKTENKSTKIVETMNLVSQITGIPELLISVERLSDVASILRTSLKERWDQWATTNTSKFDSEQLYEESLEVTLINQANTNNAQLGEFKIDMNVDLGEIDKLLGGFDKIDATFYLEFPLSLIETLKQKITFSYNTGRYKELERLEKDLVKRINTQLDKKKKYFKVAIWNDRMGELLARELLEQFLEQKQKPNLRISRLFKKIPVTFHFGVFALQYIRDKFKYRYLASNKISLQQ